MSTRVTAWWRLACLVLVAGVAACASDGDSNDPTIPVDPGPLIDPAGNLVTFGEPGDLVEGSGEGLADGAIYLPGMRFPLEAGPAFVNSQVYAPGGSQPPPNAGGQCDPSNYSYPWRDNYCEFRSWTMPLCPSGRGHQGQDIRPATCEKSVHWAVAAEAGQITGIGSYSVTLIGDSGTIHRYLHLDMSQLAVQLGDTVARGDRLGLISDDFGGTLTTIHLHYDMRQAISLDGTGLITVYVPPYGSLVDSYERLLRGTP